ncbi:MAG: hypothetical protein IPJ38_18145 [Dechloromonas sp.]|uniref:Uncharacterized protein n=1 Tax=Candidatus Dechloromonas phosphorivorans TaxID=2899244 RepID=A0A935MUI5_9RHOO|nr:hypothetical protein [Candidatus Dechloromonas phosphorivorans]
MKINQAQQIFGVVIISSGLSISADIVGCLSKQEAFSVLDICRNAVTGLKTITSRRPDLVFIVAPLPDRMVTYVIKEAKKEAATCTDNTCCRLD